TKLMSALECPQVAERFHFARAIEHLEKGRLLLFVGGTGHPYFTTDTAAALRASEIKADILLKATTRVDAIYDKDPLQHHDAKPFTKISYEEFLARKLGILDLTAITLCMSNRIPVRVFNFSKCTLWEALEGSFGTLIGM
ncbi:MAG: uridine monophosphate kinase, partial [Chlamydiales bacterium]